MNSKTQFELKRNNFIEKTIENFKFLEIEFGYSEPSQIIEEYSDWIQYENNQIDRIIIVSNEYHPVDYGFEISIYRPSVSTLHSKREMLTYLLKENQDIEQTYIPIFAKKFKAEYLNVINGTQWL